MNAQVYCKMVEEKDLQNKRLVSTIPVIDDGSPLVNLKETRLNLLFESSIIKGYDYLVREALVDKLRRICKTLKKENKILIIRSAWRSFEHQRLIWHDRVKLLQKKHPNMTSKEINDLVSYFVAPPTKSMHATGGAIDALIYDQKNARVMDFGTNEGLKLDLNKKCYPYHPTISLTAKRNRKLLIHLFENEGFVVDVKEYWHFDFGNVIWALEKKEEKAIYDIIQEVQFLK